MFVVIATGRLICTHTKALISIYKECLFFDFFFLGEGGGVWTGVSSKALQRVSSIGHCGPVNGA